MPARIAATLLFAVFVFAPTLAADSVSDIVIGFDCSDDFIAAVGGTLEVSGTLELAVTGIPCPAGREYILIENDGTDPIIGTFDGIPEGGIIVSAGQRFQISYIGGSGNDLTATAIGPGEVPTLDEWALMLLCAVLAGAAVMVLRR